MSDSETMGGFGIDEKRNRVVKEEQKRIVELLRHRLSRRSEISFAYLHGSFLEGLPYKDVDIAVFYGKEIPPDRQLDISLSLAAELSHKLGVTVDIHSLNNATAAFRYQATTGKVLFAKDREYLFEFMEATWKEFLDMKPLLEENLIDMVKT